MGKSLVTVGLLGASLVAACAAPPSPSGLPVTSTTEAGPFTLTLDLPRDSWRAGEAIEGMATLRVKTGDATVWGSGGGLIGYEFVDATGAYSMAAVSRPDCAAYPITPEAPVTSPLWMSGAWKTAPPQQFSLDGRGRLPAGTWDLTAVAAFGGTDCVGMEPVRASVRVTVVP